jgi:endonuclease G, mitochondrial
MKKLLVSLLLVSSSAFASDCLSLYPNKIELKPKNTVELCSSFFVSMYDANNRAVIAVSEHLLQGSDVGKEERVNAFHSNSYVKNSPVPGEYLNTGYDKGHMAPAGDSASVEQMRETFLMTNMTPQEPTVNRDSWRMLEEQVRKEFARTNSDIWVLNIAIYQPTPKRIGKGIPVPSGYWKVVYLPSGTQFFYCDNKPNSKVVSMSSVDVVKLLENGGNF